MKLRMIAMLLIAALVLTAAAGCKAKDPEEMGSLGEYNGTINMDENAGGSNQPSGDSNAGNNPSNDGTSEPTDQPSAGGNTSGNSTNQNAAGNNQGTPQGNNQNQNNGQSGSQGGAQNKPNQGATQNNSQGNAQNNNQTNTPSQNKPQGGTQQKPQGNGNAGGSTAKPNAGGNTNAGTGAGNSGSGNAGQAGSLEFISAVKAIAVAAGETICYGPASSAQQQQLTFTDAAGVTTQVDLSGVQKIDTFGDGFVIYSYKAPAAGSVSITASEQHKDLFIAAKGAMDINEFYRYWDNKQGRNLYDAGLDKSSKWIDGAGKAQESALGGATHAIPVTAGETITFGPVSSGYVLGYGYDAQMKPAAMVNGYQLKEAFVFPQGMRAYTYTVPEGVSYLRLNVGAEEKDVFAITKNNELDQRKYQQLTGANPDQVEDPLYRKKCLFIGDSICAAARDSANNGLKGWARRVMEYAGAECINAGVSGAALSDCRMDRSGATEQHEIYKQITKYAGKEKFDYILIHGGVNDAWDTTPIGTVTKEFDPTFFDQTTYAGGLEMAIYTAITEFGDTAAIGYLMNFQLPRNKSGVVATNMGDYFEVGKQICEKWNISYFDMFNHQEINAKMKPLTDEHLPDGTHPDESGYDILGPYVTEYMRTMTPATKEVREALAGIE